MKRFFRFITGDVFRIAVAAAVSVTAEVLAKTGVLPEDHVASLLLSAAALVIAGATVAFRAVGEIIHGHLLDEMALMTVASIGAFCIGERLESVMVMVFFTVGQLFERAAVRRSRRSIAALSAICPDTAVVERDGIETEVDAEDVEIGDLLVLRPGARVAVDCEITAGESTLDTSAVTGESAPRAVGSGDAVPSGAINGGGLLRARALRTAENSAAGRILELVESAGERKAKEEAFVTRFARVYTPVVMGLALLLAVVPPFFAGWDTFAVPGGWLYRALTFLVVSCPCALVLSVPLAFFGGIGGAAKEGILFKGGNCFSAVARTKTVLFDKTGTLTTGDFRLLRVCRYTDDDILRLAGSAESVSFHPIARAIVREAGECPAPETAEEKPGHGVTAVIGGHRVLVGGRRLLDDAGIPVCDEEGDGVKVFIAVDGVCAGILFLSDECKETAPAAIAELRKTGVSRVGMLTGDRAENARPTAAMLEMDDVKADLLPDGKYAAVEDEIAKTPGTVTFVGDGINDAPTIARADVGVAMGRTALDATVEAADVVIPSDDVGKLPLAIRIARRTLRIARENIVISLAVKSAALVLTGLALFPSGVSMAIAMFADVGVCVIAVLNAMRTLHNPGSG